MQSPQDPAATGPGHDPKAWMTVVEEVGRPQPTSPRVSKDKRGCTSVLKSRLKKPLKFHLAFLSLLIMVFIVSVDATALAVVIPTIAKEFNGTSLEAFWANISFLLVVTVVQPLYTSLSEAIGRKTPLYGAFFLFGVGSIIFAMAQSMPIIIVARALQGSGCGGLDVLNEVIVADITTLQERAFYIGIVSIPFALGSISGPILGALLNDHLSWRWIGWINLPLIGLCLPLTIWCMSLKKLPDSILAQLSSMDWYGLLLFTLGSVSFSLPLSWAGTMYAWNSWRTLVPFFLGVGILVLFVWYESKPVQPLFPYRIFHNRTAVAALILSLIHGMIFYTLIFHLPLYFQSVYMETPFRSSVSLLPFFAVLMAFTGIAAVGVEWSRRYRWEVHMAWAFISVGIGLLTLCGPDSSIAQSVGFQILAAIGLGSLFTVLPIPMQANTKMHEDQGLAVGILVSFRLFGALLGLSVSATAFSNQFSIAISSFSSLMPEVDFVQDQSKALGVIPYLREVDVTPALLRSIQDVYAQSFRTVFYVLAGLGCFGFLVSLVLKEMPIESEETGRQAFDA